MNIESSIYKIAQEAKSWRRLLHKNPGVAYQERYANDLILEKLAAWEISCKSGWGTNIPTHSGIKGPGGHGVVATIDGAYGPGPTIGLRADMDALPITESSGLEWASKKNGVMHACGHDGHTAILLGVANYFSNPAKRKFAGTLKLIFQPAEEGAKGMRAMINEGLLEKHPMDAVFALHNWPDLPLGQIAVHPSVVMASSCYFDINLRGSSAHVAKFEKAVSAIAQVGEIITRFPESHRSGDASRWRSVELTHINTGAPESRGTIPGEGLLQGSIRTFNPNIEQEIKATIAKLCSEFNATVMFRDGSPATINTEAEAKLVRAAANKTVGSKNVIWDGNPEMTAEDFGFLSDQVPLCYFWLGQGDPEKPETERALHNSAYGYNDDATPIGIQTMVNIVRQTMG